MSSSFGSHQSNGWVSCQTEDDWRILQTLIDYHGSEEPPDLTQLETLYKCPPTKQTLVKILMINQQPVGFYIVRIKGIQEDGLPLEMCILDGVFICKAHRRQGWGTTMIQDIITHLPDQDVGLRQPISHSLELVVKKFLTNNPQHRGKLWSVQNCGEEGDRLNLWFTLALKR